MLTETLEAFGAHRANYLRGGETTLVHLLEKNAIDLTPFCGVRFNELNGKIGIRSAITALRYERNTIGETRVALLFGAQRFMEGIHHRCDMRREITCLL